MTVALFLAVAIGGAAGALLRYLVSAAASGRGPLAVLIVNVVGSFVSGVAIAAIDDPAWSVIVISGLCGGLTTFSTLGVETVQLILQRRSALAVLSVIANIVLGVLAVLGGLSIGTGLFAG